MARRRNGIVLAAGTVFLAAALARLFWPGSAKPPIPDPGAPARDAAAPERMAASNPPLRVAWEELQSASGADAAREILANLRRTLAAMTADAAATRVRAFLETQADAPTHLPFAVGQDGFLTESPTLRVFLLDYLATVDRAGAAAYSETILTTMNSPDEWAVALRNYALGNATPEARDFLERKMQRLLANEAWQKEASTGYLEAFDVAVYLRDTSLLPALTSLVRRTDNPAVAHAAFLALDRMTIVDATEVLGRLASEPDLMKGRELTRANYFVRADARDSRQRRLLEDYLLNPALAPAELEKFAGLYPNANFMLSPNLLTRATPPDNASLAARDAAALRTVEDWLGDERFVRVRPQLQTVQQRLQSFVHPPPLKP